MLSLDEIKEIEFGLVRSLQGGRIDWYNNSTLRWAPYEHQIVGIYDGSLWMPVVSEPVYCQSSGYDLHGSLLSASTNYDVFARYQSTDSFNLELVPWSSSTARAKELTRLEGVLVYDNTTVSGQQMRYLGTVRTTASITFANTTEQRFVVNWDNTVRQVVNTYNSNSADWAPAYGDTTWSEYRDGTSQVRGEFLCIHGGSSFKARVQVLNSATANDMYPIVGLALNSTSTYSGKASHIRTSNLNVRVFGSSTWVTPVVGYNYITIILKAFQANTHSTTNGSSSYTKGFALVNT